MKTKHLIMAFAFTGMAMHVSGQLYTPSGLVETSTGGPSNVGVGINNPDARLVVRGLAPSGALRVTAISKYAGTGSLLSDPAFLLRLQYDNTGSMLFPQGDQTVFNVDHNGRTQIGDFPIVPGDDYLAVRSSAGIYHTTTEYFRLRYSGNNHEIFWLSNGNRNFRFRNSNTGAIPLTLSPAGKVGVGTANFAGNHALHVKGTGVHEDIYVQAENAWGQDNSFAGRCTPPHLRYGGRVLPAQTLNLKAVTKHPCGFHHRVK